MRHIPAASVPPAAVLSIIFLLALNIPMTGRPSHAQQAPAAVAHVIDGDTVILTDKTRVRLIGLDTPELGRDRRPDQPFARAAKSRLKALVKGRSLRMESDVEKRDRHGRKLAYLFSGDRMINEVMLEAGLARVFIIGPNTLYAERLIKAERKARQGKRGLWGSWKSR